MIQMRCVAVASIAHASHFSLIKNGTMNVQIIVDILGVLVGGGAGVGFTQLYNMRANKRKLDAEAEKEKHEAARKEQDNRQDAFDTMYQELNKCMSDYAAISEEYREYREKARKYEEGVQQQIQDKCLELAEMKSKILYLKGIRCYNTACKERIRVNPDKKVADIEEKLENI